MVIWMWVGLFALVSLFAAWVVFWGGADWLEENVLAAILIDIHSVHTSSEQLRLVFLVGWLLYFCWFVFGLFSPESRTFWL